ncbi:tryptophan synthase beta subunit-like PLP-dependent enzyme [Suhomyces tanzawaensis NRRL Y-17324]|uniref:L-serine ammonia-lyase n=1 Tax=Suhomyces tanzawaensis NRRL Y-17324 TaxID=984487 RepID=A0A1E4SIH2_9ASCO|nr:tryptophan synthase beta subunit-like PLP-dependent enzyme [Suhomyces tanzawaensis NRRL Y-17324]ODV79298.1 tryptophan synthase beta subunit-like PLP-dependent enzyme [Suhomyces tanzawaensis NRRL Y-17324]
MTSTKPSISTSLVTFPHNHFKILFKNESEQPSGSFKLRGLGHLIGHLIHQAQTLGKTNVAIFSSSGGNAGLAAAFSSKHYGLKCTVVLPTISKKIVISQLEALGATVIVHGAHWGEADEYLRTTVIGSLDDSIYPVYCHPFDDPIIWDGHAQLVDELLQQLENADTTADNIKGVVCSVGGGGLYNGVVEGLQRNGLSVPVLAVETTQTNCFSSALDAGKVVRLANIKTLATSLGSPYISQKSLDNHASYPTTVKVIDDLDAVQGVIDHFDHTGSLVEPACGATMAFAYGKVDQLEKVFGKLTQDDVIVFVVCGGTGVDQSILEEYRKLVEAGNVQ